MLKNKFLSFNFYRYVQSGMYLDFFFKKIVESYVKNSFIYTAQFFGEKYIIEYLTKKIIDSVLFNNNKIFFIMDLTYSYFFIQLISIIVYTNIIINILILL